MGQNFTYPPGWSAVTTPVPLNGRRTDFTYPKLQGPPPPIPATPPDHLPSLATEAQAAPMSDNNEWWLTPDERSQNAPEIQGPPPLPRLPGPPAGFRPDVPSGPPQGSPPWAGLDPTTAVSGEDYDPTAVSVDAAYGAPGDKVSGHMSYGGPQLNTEGALAGLKRAAGQFETPMISTEELQKQAARDPRTVAPGANQWATGELESRQGSEAFANLLGRKQQETASNAITAQHPAVKAGAEQAARRAAYPAQASAGATALAAKLGLQGDTVRADATVEAARSARDAKAIESIMRTIQELEKNSGFQETPEDKAARLTEIGDYKKLVNQWRAGQLVLTDEQSNALAGEGF